MVVIVLVAIALQRQPLLQLHQQLRQLLLRQQRQQRLINGRPKPINQSINQVYCTEPCHTHTINLTNKNKREKSHT